MFYLWLILLSSLLLVARFARCLKLKLLPGASTGRAGGFRIQQNGTGEHPVPFFHVFKRNERKERIKKLIALLMCLSLAACDNGKTENTDHSQGQNTENTSKENQQTETASQGNGNPEC
jgi:hypothetical protein